MVCTERFKITGCLRLRQRAEGVGFTWDRQVWFHAIHQFEKDARAGPAFVELSCRVKIPWAVAECGGHTMRARQGFAQSARRRFERT